MSGKHRRSERTKPSVQLKVALALRVVNRGRAATRHDASNDRAQVAADRAQRKGQGR